MLKTKKINCIFSFLKVMAVAVLMIIAMPQETNAQTWPPNGMQGNGTENSPWQITTAEHLAALAAYVNAGNGTQTNGVYYKLMNNLDLSNYASNDGWDPIGYRESRHVIDATKAFRGNFNGNNKIITNLKINSPTNLYVGLFGHIDGATIENLSIEQYDICGHCIDALTGNAANAGSLVASATNATITNCYATGNMRSDKKAYHTFGGGLIGLINGGIINHCHAMGSVTGYFYCGGLVGSISNTTVINCYAISNGCSGGLIGYASNDCHITDCYATGNVGVGGLVGEARGCDIINCYATGDVSSGDSDYCGGLVGYTSGCNIDNCYAIGSVSGYRICGGLIGLSTHGNNDAFLGSITNCYAIGDVTIQKDDIDSWGGGLVGTNSYTTITNCYATGNVKTASARCSIGGLVGTAFFDITNCYATGNVTGYDTGSSYYEGVGGLVGGCMSVTITNCYATGSVIGKEYVGGLAGMCHGSIRNCVAANSSIKATISTSNINRIVGGIGETSIIKNNYAFEDMVVNNNGTIITPVNGLNTTAGMGKGMAMLQTLAFYTANANWLDEAWDISGLQNSTETWMICEDKNVFPFLRWQGIDCEGEIVIITTILPNGTKGTEYNATLTATGAAITWSIESGTLPNGLHLNPVTGNISGTPTTVEVANFTVRATNGISNDERMFSIVITETGIIEIEENEKIQVYPNPTQSKFIIDTKVIATIKLYDLLGKEALTQNANGKTEINISHLPNGFYVVKVFSDNKTIGNAKIVKQ